MKLARNDPRHGTRNGYHNHGCRCDRCRTANTEYHRTTMHRLGVHRPRAVWLAELRAQEPPEHGTEGRYTHHRCRCDECKRAAREARARRRQKVAA